ncbi:glutamate--tRNA ligase, chloroplastic/mitochondrial-like [Nicotiana sylvestris]|uniref:glutamate--tRNA ligase, chloroplastic/mitochondrial-like n=1 Tax=Nicotiana sylvestris TaxID=4096 RepID=UPI00388C3591
MGIVDTNGVDFATFHLSGSAKTWWRDYCLSRPAGSPALAWEQFVQLFLEKFLPIIERGLSEQGPRAMVQAPGVPQPTQPARGGGKGVKGGVRGFRCGAQTARGGGQPTFRDMGYLPQAMANYLALLGWGDGTENEFFTLEQLVEKFTIERVNKSGAIFDSTKLRWMNGQHLRSIPSEELNRIIGERWKDAGITTESQGIFIQDAVLLLKDGIDLITDSEKALSSLLSYPLYETLASAEGKPILEDGVSEVAKSLLAAYDSGELSGALAEGWQKWVKNFGKLLKRKVRSEYFLFPLIKILFQYLIRLLYMQRTCRHAFKLEDSATSSG